MSKNVLGVEWTSKVADGGSHFFATIDNIHVVVKREFGETWGIFAGEHEVPIGGGFFGARVAMCAAKAAVPGASMHALLKPHADKVVVELTKAEARALIFALDFANAYDPEPTPVEVDMKATERKIRRAINVADAI